MLQEGRVAHAWGRISRPIDLASASKPVVAYFLLRALADGRIASLDAPVVGYLPGLAELNPELGHPDRQITWRHLVTQTSNYGFQESPGEAFNYDDYAFALLWEALVQGVYRVAAENADSELLEPLLVAPLAFDDPASLQAGRTPGRAKMSLRDFARFGRLFGQRGRAGGQSVLPESIAAMAIGTPHPVAFPRTTGLPAERREPHRSFGGGHNQEDHLGSYSYTWWRNGEARRLWPDLPADAFGAFGRGTQIGLVVVPSRDLVVAWRRPGPDGLAFSDGGHQRVNRELAGLFLEAGPPAAPPAATLPKLSGRDAPGLGPLRPLGEGATPACAATADGGLYLLARTNSGLVLSRWGTGDEPTFRIALPDTANGSHPEIALSPAGDVHVAWDTHADAWRARFRDGTWSGRERFPKSYARRNQFPQLVPDGDAGVFGATWSIDTTIGAGDCMFSHREGDEAPRLLRTHGGCRLHGPAIAPAALEGWVHALEESGATRHRMLHRDGRVRAPSVVLYPPGGALIEGLTSIGLPGGDLAVVTAWRAEDGRHGYLASTLRRGRAGRPPIPLVPGDGAPTLAYHAGRVWLLSIFENRPWLTSWDPRSDEVRPIGHVADEIDIWDSDMPGRGNGAGCLLAREDGLEVIFSAGAQLHRRRVAVSD